MVRVQSRYKTTLHATYVPTPTRHDTPTATHTHMHACTHTHASTHTCKHTPTHGTYYSHTCTHTCKHKRMHASHSHTHALTHTHTQLHPHPRTYACKQAPTHPHAHTHTHTHTHTRTHAHIHTHIHILEQEFRLCRSQTQEKPVDYNQHMFGVDKLDQLVSYYSFLHKSVKWWRRFSFGALRSLLSTPSLFSRNWHSSGEYAQCLTSGTGDT